LAVNGGVLPDLVD